MGALLFFGGLLSGGIWEAVINTLGKKKKSSRWWTGKLLYWTGRSLALHKSMVVISWNYPPFFLNWRNQSTFGPRYVSARHLLKLKLIPYTTGEENSADRKVSGLSSLSVWRKMRGIGPLQGVLSFQDQINPIPDWLHCIAYRACLTMLTYCLRIIFSCCPDRQTNES